MLIKFFIKEKNGKEERKEGKGKVEKRIERIRKKREEVNMEMKKGRKEAMERWRKE